MCRADNTNLLMQHCWYGLYIFLIVHVHVVMQSVYNFKDYLILPTIRLDGSLYHSATAGFRPYVSLILRNC